MKFVDEVDIRVQSGAGGNGCISFRREKFVPFGGPNGGNGGRGGDVYLVATRNKQSLLDFKYKSHFAAERGEHGLGKEMDGRSGEDLHIEVPIGTVIYDSEDGEILKDLQEDSVPYLVARGGKGGRGNKSFVSSVQRAPRKRTPGEEGVEKTLRLELKLLADVGLVGFPNAGKSSLLRSLSRATPKVADYPFTTLSPCLGVVSQEGKNVVFADLPGLIKGAADGAGLGHQFLRHCARNRVLVHVVDGTTDEEEILDAIKTIEAELRSHDKELLERPKILAMSKVDLLSEEEVAERLKILRDSGYDPIPFSNMTKTGHAAITERVWAILDAYADTASEQAQ